MRAWTAWHSSSAIFVPASSLHFPMGLESGVLSNLKLPI